MQSIWSQCEPDDDQTRLLQELDQLMRSEGLSRKSQGGGEEVQHRCEKTAGGSVTSTTAAHPCSVNSMNNNVSVIMPSSDVIHESLKTVESSCKIFIKNLDDILSVLETVESAHTDVTGRTNSLMMNCETLLEQQHTLQSLVTQLQHIIKPFNDVEEVASQLGFPVDATGKPYSSINPSLQQRAGVYGSVSTIASGHSIDPRSSEFREVLLRISSALKFLEQSPGLRDFDQYLGWLKQLQRRANSLVSKAMISLLENANSLCEADAARKDYKKTYPTGPNVSATDLHTNDVTASATPALESMQVYTKFRNLGFRMRELGYMLRCSELSEGRHHTAQVAGTFRDKSRTSYSSEDFLHHFNSRNNNQGNNSGETRSASGDVLATYKQIRCGLLAPIIRSTPLKTKIDEILSTAPARSGGSESTGGPHSQVAPQVLCALVRSAFATVLHITQLEQQLYVTLFHTTGGGGANSATTVSAGKSSVSSASIDRSEIEEKAIREKEEADSFVEVSQIVSEISGEINGHLRAVILKGSVGVEGLCRVIHTITEDVQSQLNGTRLHPTVYTCLYESLHRTASDARERLMFCAEVELRKLVQLFEPLPSQLDYPGLLEKKVDGSALLSGGAGAGGVVSVTETNSAAARLRQKSGISTTNSGESVSESSVLASSFSDNSGEDISKTWYPPLKHTLSLLALLYGVVDSTVFEDIARRAVAACIESLVQGAAGVRRWKDKLHGDFFLTRHLLILREQLLPFDMKLQAVEKHLDFTSTGSALSSFISNSRSLLRLDQTNSLLHLARDGLPGMYESQVDVKKKMDEHLKASCQALKLSAIHFLLGPLENFLAKVTAFINSEIPLYRYESVEYEKNLELEKEQSVLLSPEACESLKNQSFVKPDRIKVMLNSVVETVAQSHPIFLAASQLYIENQITRDIVMKPVYQEMTFVIRRMRTIIASCLNHGQERKDLETLLSSIRMSLKSAGH